MITKSKSVHMHGYGGKTKLDFRINYSSQREEALRTAFDYLGSAQDP